MVMTLIDGIVIVSVIVGIIGGVIVIAGMVGTGIAGAVSVTVTVTVELLQFSFAHYRKDWKLREISLLE